MGEPQKLQAWRAILLEVLADAMVQLDEDEKDHKAAVDKAIDQLIKAGALLIKDREPEVGEQVLAVLTEDDDWHPAVVEEILKDKQLRVVFVEYAKPQVAA